MFSFEVRLYPAPNSADGSHRAQWDAAASHKYPHEAKYLRTLTCGRSHCLERLEFIHGGLVLWVH